MCIQSPDHQSHGKKLVQSHILQVANHSPLNKQYTRITLNLSTICGQIYFLYGSVFTEWGAFVNKTNTPSKCI